ncbi:MAG: hypothetical protein U0930_02905 [Pirellulales bacterium]
MSTIPATVRNLSSSRLLFAALVILLAQIGLAQDDPKLNELQSYVRNLDSVKSYVCRAYFFRFGRTTTSFGDTYTFVTSNVCDYVADISIDSQLSFENKRLARNVEDFESSTIRLKVGAKVFERSELKEMAQRDSTMVFGPFNPLSLALEFSVNSITTPTPKG